MLISLFILNGCKNPDGVGLDIDPSEQIQGTLIDTLTVNSKLIPEDSIVTTNLAKLPLALIKDDVLGLTEANIITSLGLPGATKFTPSGTAVVDSAVLILKYTSGFYGDSLNTNYTINVHQLQERPYLQNYYNTKNWDFSPEIIGSRSFYARPTDSLYIRDIVVGGDDTLKKVAAQLRVPIDVNFIKQRIFSASASQLASEEAFNNYIKGLYITLDKDQTIGGKGGAFYFQLDSSALDVYYKIDNNDTTETSVASFSVNKVSVAKIQHDYSGTVVEDAMNSTSSSETVSYVQGLLGLRTKISFPYLKELKESAGDIIINRAELVITPITPVDYVFAPASRLSLYRYDIAKQRINLPDATSTDPRFIGLGSFNGFYDPSKKAYRFVITGYIQDLLRGRLTDYGTFVSPSDLGNLSTVDLSPSILTAGRTVFGGGANTAGQRIKLNIIYTKIN
jgi:hypothetical protein